MTTRDALLQAIIDAPEDDVPRLVYADLLEETGVDADLARARLIRLQIETARLPDDHPEKESRFQEAMRLTDRYRAEWFGWVRDEDCRPFPQRGFLDSWFCGTDQEHEDDLTDAFRHEPITKVTLAPNGGNLPALAAWPQLTRLRNLSLWPRTPQAEDVETFLSSRHLSGLRGFSYMGRRGPRVALAEKYSKAKMTCAYCGRIHVAGPPRRVERRGSGFRRTSARTPPMLCGRSRGNGCRDITAMDMAATVRYAAAGETGGWDDDRRGVDQRCRPHETAIRSRGFHGGTASG